MPLSDVANLMLNVSQAVPGLPGRPAPARWIFSQAAQGLLLGAPFQRSPFSDTGTRSPHG